MKDLDDADAALKQLGIRRTTEWVDVIDIWEAQGVYGDTNVVIRTIVPKSSHTGKLWIVVRLSRAGSAVARYGNFQPYDSWEIYIKTAR